MKRVLITGGNGALGRALVKKMRYLAGYEVTVADRECISDSAVYVRCDVCDHGQLFDVFNRIKPDLLLHLAATFGGDLGEAYATNVVPSRQILDLVERSKLSTRVILIGSAAEYGIVHADENPLCESRVLMPVSVYGVSKAWQSQLVTFYKARGIDVLCARIFNLFGPGVSARLFAGRIQHQINEVLAGKMATIDIGPLSAVRDYLSTEEAADQLLAIAMYGESGEIYHVASGAPIVMAELLLKELKKYGLDLSIVRQAANLSNHSGYDVPVIYADVTKTRKLIAAGV